MFKLLLREKEEAIMRMIWSFPYNWHGQADPIVPESPQVHIYRKQATS